MNNMKVSSRLAWGFGILLALLVVCIGVSLSNLKTLNDSIDLLAENRVPKLLALDDIAYRTMDNTRIVRNMILLDDPKVIASNKEAYDKNSAEVEKHLAYLEKHFTHADDQELMKTMATARAAFRNYTKEVIAFALDNLDEDATRALYGAGYKTQEAYLAVIRALVDSQKAKVDKAGHEADAVVAQARNLMIGLGVAALLLGAALAFLITRSLVRQLGGEPAYAAEVVQRIADGDLTAHVETQPGDSTSVLAAMKAMRDKLAQVVGGVRDNAEAVASASGQISQGNNDLSSRTEEQASALQQTAASMKQLASTVRQNADNAVQGNQLALTASTVAARGGEVVGQVVQTMKGINDSSKKIADIISVIDGIAFQTNILALNAAVEAARAGEQGRGFAVVASEVRSLAQRSADAAKEIKGLITASVERVEQGSALVDQAGSTMTEVVQSIRRVTDLMGEISAASNEQSAGVAQVDQAVNQMDQATQQNAALVEESAAAAGSLKSQAQQLVGAVAVFKLAA